MPGTGRVGDFPPNTLKVTLGGKGPKIEQSPGVSKGMPPRPATRPSAPLRPDATTAVTGPSVVIHDWEPNVPRAMLEGLIPGPRYLLASELHRHPIPLAAIRPEYPVGAEDMKGKVMLLVLINEGGGVDRAGVLAADPPGVFDASALAAFQFRRYAPGLVAGIPVRSQLLVEVSYEPGDPPKVNLPTISTTGPGALENQANSLGKGN